MTLPGGSFVPPPEVDVGLVKIIPHSSAYIQNMPLPFMNKVITGLFLTKKVKFMKSIKFNLIPKDLREEVAPVLAEALDIPEHKSPIELSMAEISRICFAY